MLKIVSTSDFWDLTCRPGFDRQTDWSGVLDGVTYVCGTAPEDDNNFLTRKLEELRKSLK